MGEQQQTSLDFEFHEESSRRRSGVCAVIVGGGGNRGWESLVGLGWVLEVLDLAEEVWI
jgi:hypothetical protein